VGATSAVPGGPGPQPVPSTPFGPVGGAIPLLAGQPEAVAAQQLQAMGLTVLRQAVAGAPAEAGRVRGTQPPAGTNVAPGAQVTLLVVEATATPALVPLPNYVGMNVAAAQADLAARGFTPAVQTMVSAGAVDGQVVAQAPIAMTMVAPGTAVSLTVARAPTLAQPVLLGPPSGTATPKNFGVLFQWAPVPDAEDYQFEIFKWKGDSWVTADNDITQGTQKRPSRVHAGTYQWHIRARRARGTILSPWSEWRRLTIY